MTTVWIAKKNPPFKRGGIDKPMFFNSHWKRKNNWDDATTIQKTIEVFDKQFFETTGIQGEISQAIDFQNFKVRLPKNANEGAEIFRSSFFKVVLGNETFPRYCWVTETKYMGQNTIEFTLETDLWITFMPQITFDGNKSVETKRCMNERYSKVEGDALQVDVWGNGNQFWDDLGKRSYEFQTKIGLRPIPNNDFTKLFQFFSNSEVYAYAMLIPTEDMDAFKTGAVAPFLNKDTRNIPPAGLIIPLYPDDGTMPPNPGTADDKVWLANAYNTAATQIASTVLAGVFLLPMVPPLENKINVDATTQYGYALAKLNEQIGFVSISKYGIDDWLGQSSPEYDETTYIKNEEPFLFSYGKLLQFSLDSNEPCYWNHQTTSIQINNGNKNGPEIPFEYFWSSKGMNPDTTRLFVSKIVFSGTVLSVVHYIKFDNNIFGEDLNNYALLNENYTTVFQVDASLPSATTGWTNYMQNNRNSFYNSQAQGKFNAGMGIINGVINPNATFGSAVSAVGNSIFALRELQAQVADMKNQAGASNNASLDMAGIIAKGDILNENINADNYNYREAIVGVPYVKRVPPDIQRNIIKHYRLFGNPTQQRIPLSYPELQRREFWNFWQVEDIQNTFVFDSIPPFVIDALDKMFSDGVRLWPIWWNTDNSYIDTIYNYDIENYETSLKLEIAPPEEITNGIL